MKLIISSTALQVAARQANKVINPKNALPILGDLLLRADEADETLTVTGSDGETWVTRSLQLQTCEGGGAFCVDAAKLLDALSELSEQPVTIIADTENGSEARFRLQHETGETEFPLENADEYPTALNVEEDSSEWTFNTAMLNRTLRRSLFATASDDLRPIMSGVCFDLQADVLNVVASDGHKLIKNAETLDALAGNATIVIPKKVAKMLPDLMTDEETDITFSEKIVRFSQSTVSVTFRPIEGKYPNYDSVIPKDAPYSLECDRQQLLKAVRNVAHFTNSSSRMVVLTITDNQRMQLRGEDFGFSQQATDSIDIDYPHQQSMTIGVKADSFIESLTRIAEPRICLRFIDPSRTLTIHPVNPLYQGEELTLLCMPMLVND